MCVLYACSPASAALAFGYEDYRVYEADMFDNFPTLMFGQAKSGGSSPVPNPCHILTLVVTCVTRTNIELRVYGLLMAAMHMPRSFSSTTYTE
jgi:hypothetical protein